MDKNDIILEKLEKMEDRLNALEGLSKEPSNNSKNVIHINTIDPSDMQVGKFAYVGKYESQDKTMKSTFGADRNDIKLLFVPENSFEMAKIIDAFSSEDRINIVKLLVTRSRSTKELMEKLQYQTTGKLYHHLSFLEKIGVVQKHGDKYHVSARYISCIILIFSGVNNILRKNSSETKNEL